MGAGFEALCRITGTVLLHIAFGCAIVAVATSWVQGHVTTDIKIAEADEHLHISLWRREVTRSPGEDHSELWHDYVNRAGRSEEYCPDPQKGTTYGDVFKRIQAAEACACIGVIMGLLMIVASIIHTCGYFPSRIAVLVPASFLIAAEIGAIIAWMNFYNLCDDNFCQRYVNQLKATEGSCNLAEGFAFACAAIGLTVLGLIPLCAAGPHAPKGWIRA